MTPDTIEKIVAEMRQDADRCRASNKPDYVVAGSKIHTYANQIESALTPSPQQPESKEVMPNARHSEVSGLYAVKGAAHPANTPTMESDEGLVQRAEEWLQSGESLSQTTELVSTVRLIRDLLAAYRGKP